MTTTKPKPHAVRKPKVKTLAHLTLDMSGSMGSIKDSTIEAFNGYLGELKKEKNMEMGVSFFNSNIGCKEKVASKKVADLPPLTANTYNPDGATPLYDAIGHTIGQLEAASKEGDQVLVVIQTDGLENASTEFGQRKIFDLVREKTEKGWQFLFLGCDLDAMAVGQTFGVAVGQTMSYTGKDPASVGAAVMDASRRSVNYASASIEINVGETRDYRTAGEASGLILTDSTNYGGDAADTPEKPKEYGEEE